MEVNIKAREESHTTSHGNALSIPTCLVMHFHHKISWAFNKYGI
jgi:hypothetical protein